MMKKKKDMAAAEQAPKGAAGRARAAAREESRRLKAEAEASRLAALMAREAELREAGYQAVAGLDEAGRGPLAGPVVAGAVILRPGSAFAGLNDSKKVTLANRLRLEAEIKAGAAAWAVGLASPEEIDRLNILGATKLAMERALQALSLKLAPDYLLLDALRLPSDLPQEGIIKGDAKVACIAAASILAKTCRDRIMAELDEAYPGYGFARHKGYPTAAHRQAVLELGPSPVHRQSFLGFYEREKQQLQLF